jgi:hypothetical protein
LSPHAGAEVSGHRIRRPPKRKGRADDNAAHCRSASAPLVQEHLQSHLHCLSRSRAGIRRGAASRHGANPSLGRGTAAFGVICNIGWLEIIARGAAVAARAWRCRPTASLRKGRIAICAIRCIWAI